MRNIKARFKEQEKKYPYHGAYINLSKAVRGQKFSRKSLVKAFKELMPNEEYEKSEMFGLINYLELVTNDLEEGEKRGKNLSEGALNQECDKNLKGLVVSEISLKI